MPDPQTLNFFEVCDVADLWVGEMQAFDVGEHEVLVINVDGQLHAYDGVCPHQSVSLVEGALEGGVLTCRAHHWTFEACSGKGLNPAAGGLRRFPLRIENGKVLVCDQADEC